MSSKKVKKFILFLLKLSPSSVLIGPPKGLIKTRDWLLRNGLSENLKSIYKEENVTEKKPVTLDKSVHKIFSNETHRVTPEAFVAKIPNGRVWGVDGIVITPDNLVLEDVSREFGKYKGKYGLEMSVFDRFYLGKKKHYKGTVAVIATPGSTNYHHWLYDLMPRFHLLRKAEMLDQIDYFILNYSGTSFQKQCLSKLGIPTEKIIVSRNRWKFHISADILIVPSLPDTLSQSNAWSISYLRSLFLRDGAVSIIKRLYIDRRKAATRKVINQQELDTFLDVNGFERFFPEDYSIDETAKVFAAAEIIIGIHGSGFANVVFCSQGVKVIDIVAPYHVDPVYYILTNGVGGTYSYLFGEGERPSEDMDLVVKKVDSDILLDIGKLQRLCDKMVIS